jgi:hypothetical protein
MLAKKLIYTQVWECIDLDTTMAGTGTAVMRD